MPKAPLLPFVSAQPDTAKSPHKSAPGRKKYHRYLERLESKRRKDWELDGCLVRKACSCC